MAIESDKLSFTYYVAIVPVTSIKIDNVSIANKYLVVIIGIHGLIINLSISGIRYVLSIFHGEPSWEPVVFRTRHKEV
jgi:hypothetical protein